MTQPAIESRNLTFRYPGSAEAVIVGFNLSTHQGQMVAIQGPSGCGKSTLLYLLGLLITPDAGEIILHGHETTQFGDGDRSRIRAHHIGVVFQDAALHPDWTIEQNVAEGGLYGGMRYSAALIRARTLMESQGIAAVSSRRPTQVSGGQAQRAALCRALVRDPSIVLADEPTGNLDPPNAAAVVGGLREAANNGAAVIVVTHSRMVANACDRVLYLS